MKIKLAFVPLKFILNSLSFNDVVIVKHFKKTSVALLE